MNSRHIEFGSRMRIPDPRLEVFGRLANGLLDFAHAISMGRAA